MCVIGMPEGSLPKLLTSTVIHTAWLKNLISESKRTIIAPAGRKVDVHAYQRCTDPDTRNIPFEGTVSNQSPSSYSFPGLDLSINYLDKYWPYPSSFIHCTQVYLQLFTAILYLYQEKKFSLQSFIFTQCGNSLVNELESLDQEIPWIFNVLSFFLSNQIFYT